MKKNWKIVGNYSIEGEGIGLIAVNYEFEPDVQVNKEDMKTIKKQAEDILKSMCSGFIGDSKCKFKIKSKVVEK